MISVSVTFLGRLTEMESQSIWVSPSADSRTLRCLRTSEGPLLIGCTGFPTAAFYQMETAIFVGFPSLINAIPWDISVGIWEALWKFTSVTVLIPPGRSLTHSARQTRRQSFQTMSAPSLQGVALLFKKTKNLLIAIYLFMFLGMSLWACHQADWIHGIM